MSFHPAIHHHCANVTDHKHFVSGSSTEGVAQTEEDPSSALLELLRNQVVIGLLLMLAIIINILWVIWCTKAYEDPHFVLDTKMKIAALWRDYTPCGILSVFSGRRERGWTTGEAMEALNLRREANRLAEAKALATAVAKRPKLEPAVKRQPQGSLRSGNRSIKTGHKTIQKAKKTNIREKNIRFIIDDCLAAQGLGGNLKMSNRTITFKDKAEKKEFENSSCRRTSFRKINVTYKRPLPPLPAYTFEDKNVKIVMSDICDSYETPVSELKSGTSHRYECLDYNAFTVQGAGAPVRPTPQLDGIYEPVDP